MAMIQRMDVSGVVKNNSDRNMAIIREWVSKVSIVCFSQDFFSLCLPESGDGVAEWLVHLRLGIEKWWVRMADRAINFSRVVVLDTKRVLNGWVTDL